MSSLIDKAYPIPYNVIVPLQHMAAVKIVQTICYRIEIMELFAASNADILEGILDLRKGFDVFNVETIVKSYVCLLPLTESLQEEVLQVVELTVVELFEWIRYNNGVTFSWFSSNLNSCWYLNNIVWKCQGIVDHIATAKTIIRDEYMTDYAHLFIACAYSLEDEIKAIYPRAEEYFDNYPRLVPANQKILFDYWASFHFDNLQKIKTQVAEKNTTLSLDAFMIEICALDELEYAACYFWNKLNYDEKIQMSVEFVGGAALRAPFVWPYMSEVQEEKMFKKYGGFFLNKILKDVYWCKYYVSVMKRYCKMITSEFMPQLLDGFCEAMKDKTRCRCSKFADILLQFWDCVPIEAKRHVIRNKEENFTKILIHLHEDIFVDLFLHMFSGMDYKDIKNYLFTNGVVSRLATVVAKGGTCKKNVFRFFKHLLSLEDARIYALRLKKKLTNVRFNK